MRLLLHTALLVATATALLATPVLAEVDAMYAPLWNMPATYGGMWPYYGGKCFGVNCDGDGGYNPLPGFVLPYLDRIPTVDVDPRYDFIQRNKPLETIPSAYRPSDAFLGLRPEPVRFIIRDPRTGEIIRIIPGY
ncbi:unnamed protein product [Pedinophyceae sp. YPF-701]|nr:unnamed protein product [Pedinophyceae sp. YPF-701]